MPQIQSGLAWRYKKYETEQSVEDRKVDAEVKARKLERGLWMDANPVVPWQWRRNAQSKRLGRLLGLIIRTTAAHGQLLPVGPAD